MVKVAGTFGRSGVHDYVLLRASALILLAYVLYFIGFVTFADISYSAWVGFFSLTLTKVFSLFALIAYARTCVDRYLASVNRLHQMYCITCSIAVWFNFCRVLFIFFLVL